MNNNKTYSQFGKFDDTKFNEFIKQGHREGRRNLKESIDRDYELDSLYDNITSKTIKDIERIIEESLLKLDRAIDVHLTKVASRNASKLKTTKRTLKENLTIEYIEQIKPNLSNIISEVLN